MEADRTEKKNVCFDPLTRPDLRKAPSQGRPYVDVLPRPRGGNLRVVGPFPPKARMDENPSQGSKPYSQLALPIILKRPVDHPSEPKAPMKKDRVNNMPDEDIEMVDAPSEKRKEAERVYVPKTPPKMQFTTDLRQKVSLPKVMNSLYEQEVKLPLGVLLGISGDISKELNNAMCTHKDYVSKSQDVPKEAHSIQLYSNVVADSSSDESDTQSSGWADAGYKEIARLQRIGELKHVLKCNLYAMGTGRLEARVGRVEGVPGMVDSGSELNLMSRGLLNRLGLPYDVAGSAWGIRGVNGNTETLFGICRRVPIKIGGVRFDHVFFIKKDNLGSDCDMLMGQPWLQSVAAELLYGGDLPDPVQMRLYENGDKSASPIVVKLDVDHTRGATKLIQLVESDGPRQENFRVSSLACESNPPQIAEDWEASEDAEIEGLLIPRADEESPSLQPCSWTSCTSQSKGSGDLDIEEVTRQLALVANEREAADRQVPQYNTMAQKGPVTKEDISSEYRKIMQSFGQHPKLDKRHSKRIRELIQQELELDSIAARVRKKRATRRLTASSSRLATTTSETLDYSNLESVETALSAGDESAITTAERTGEATVDGKSVDACDCMPELAAKRDAHNVKLTEQAVKEGMDSELTFTVAAIKKGHDAAFHNGQPIDGLDDGQADDAGFAVDNELLRTYERLGAQPSTSVETQDEPSVPSLGRKLSEAL